jgi:PTS system nitrogen regulatory IIA component
MKLGEFVEPELILPDLSAKTKGEVLAELIAPLKGVEPGIDLQKSLNILKEREKLGTTGIGDGVAIPHGKVEDLDRIILVVGRSVTGVDFDALDFKPCTIFFLVLAPEQAAGMHLRILAHISRLLKDEEFRRGFVEADNRDEILDMLKSA